MMSRNAQTDVAVEFETSRGGEESEHRRTEGVSGREDDATVVYAACEGRGGRRTAKGEVPVEEVSV